MEKKLKDAQKRANIQIAMSILTLLLTPILSGLVVWFQMGSQHDYWKIQHKLLQDEKKLEEQLSKIKHINELVTKFDLLSLEIQVEAISTGFLQKNQKDIQDKIKLDAQIANYRKLIVDYRNQHNLFIDELQTLKFYFGDSVRVSSDSLSLYLQNKLSKITNDSWEMLNDIIEVVGKNNSEAATFELSNEILTSYQDKELRKLRLDLIGAMVDQTIAIGESSKGN